MSRRDGLEVVDDGAQDPMAVLVLCKGVLCEAEEDMACKCDLEAMVEEARVHDVSEVHARAQVVEGDARCCYMVYAHEAVEVDDAHDLDRGAAGGSLACRGVRRGEVEVAHVHAQVHARMLVVTHDASNHLRRARCHPHQEETAFHVGAPHQAVLPRQVVALLAHVLPVGAQR